MSILPNGPNRLPNPPAPVDVAAALATLNAVEVAPGVWTATLSSGARVVLVDMAAIVREVRHAL